MGVTQNIRQTANAGESSYGVDFTSLTSSMANGQMLGEDQYKSGETSEINVVDGGSVSSDGLDWGGKTMPFSGRLSKLKGRVVQQGNFAVKLVQKFHSVSEF